MQELEPLLDTDDLGHDEDAARELLKRHQELLDDLESYEFNINSLRDLSKQLIEKQNSESPNVSERQQQIETRWANLREKSAARKRALEEADKLHKFNRDAEDVRISLIFCLLVCFVFVFASTLISPSLFSLLFNPFVARHLD